MEKRFMKVTIYTDGSADNRTADFGSTCSIILFNHPTKGLLKRVIATGSWSSTTNNRMELMAVINGLNAVKKGYEIEVITDSQYNINSLKSIKSIFPKKENFSLVLNGDLLEKLYQAYLKHSECGVEMKWVKGHSGNKYNEKCDTICTQYSLLDNPTRDIGSGIEECPKMCWVMNEDKTNVRLEKMEYINEPEFYYSVNEIETFIGEARKISNKEVTNLLIGMGWKMKDIKKLEIDKSEYKKPTKLK